MYNLALFSSINFVPYERKFTQKESFQTTYVCRTSMQKTINCVIPKRLFGLLLSCWLETQNTLAVLAKTLCVVFLQIFVVILPLIKSGWIVKIQIYHVFFRLLIPLLPLGILSWFLSMLRVKTVQAEGDGG